MLKKIIRAVVRTLQAVVRTTRAIVWTLVALGMLGGLARAAGDGAGGMSIGTLSTNITSALGSLGTTITNAISGSAVGTVAQGVAAAQAVPVAPQNGVALPTAPQSAAPNLSGTGTITTGTGTGSYVDIPTGSLPTLTRLFKSLAVALAVLCAASPASEAGTKWWFPTKTLINRPHLAAPGTPGRAIDVALGLADFVVGRTSTAPLNQVISDGTRIANFLTSANSIITPSQVSAAANNSLTLYVNTAAYTGGFSSPSTPVYEPDPVTGAATPAQPLVPNVMRSSIMVADGSTLNCAVITSGSLAGVVNCAPVNYIDATVTAWNQATGALTVTVTAKGGSGSITAANAVLLRHYPENAPLSNTLTLAGQDSAGNPAVVANWDWRTYVAPYSGGVVNFAGNANGASLRITQCKTDWASDILSSGQGMFYSAGQPFSVDHCDTDWTPFRDAYQVTAAADAPAGGNQLTIQEGVPGPVATMVGNANGSVTPWSEVALPFNGRTIQASMQGLGIQKYWSVFDASNPDALFGTTISSISGNTLTMDGEGSGVEVSGTNLAAIRAAVHAGDKLFLFHQVQTDPMTQGVMCTFTYNHAVSLMDVFFFLHPPATCAASYSRNLISHLMGSQFGQHGDVFQESELSSNLSVSLKNNVIQANHFQGFQAGGNPRDITQLGNGFAWNADFELSDSIIDGSGLSSNPLYFVDWGIGPVQMVLQDQASGEVRVVPNPPGLLNYSLLNGRLYGGGSSGNIRPGDTWMVSGFPVGLTALNNRAYTVDAVYQDAAPPAVAGVVTNALTCAANSTAVTGNTLGLTPYLPITIGGTVTTVASVTTIAATGGAATLTQACATAATSATMPWSFTLKNTAGALAGLVATPYAGFVTATPNGAVLAPTTNAPAVICVTNASQIGQDMELFHLGVQTSSPAYSVQYPLMVESVDGSGCLHMSGPLSNPIGASDTLYFATWDRPAQNKSVHVHDLYIKQATFRINNYTQTGVSTNPLTSDLFYTTKATHKAISVHDLYAINDGEGTYSDGAAPMADPKRFLAGGTNGQIAWSKTWNANDYNYLVAMVGNATPMTWAMQNTWDYLDSGNPATGATNTQNLTMTKVTSFNPPCPAPTGLSAVSSATGQITLTYSAVSTCTDKWGNPNGGAGTNLGEKVSIDGVWQDSLGVIHSGSTIPALSGQHTFAVRSMDAPDDYGVPHNPGATSAAVSATVQ